jgi:hypothetical protein
MSRSANRCILAQAPAIKAQARSDSPPALTIAVQFWSKAYRRRESKAAGFVDRISWMR